ncbi:MAG: hypothetical protein LBQ01_09280, partial [Prevotellaceae bacterium]|nr:hypothetical protein [Prevotellaceae bacterium]
FLNRRSQTLVRRSQLTDFVNYYVKTLTGLETLLGFPGKLIMKILLIMSKKSKSCLKTELMKLSVKGRQLHDSE